MMETLLLPIDEVARVMGTSRATVYRLIAAGSLERVKVGRRALVTAASVRAYVDGLVGAR